MVASVGGVWISTLRYELHIVPLINQEFNQ